MTKQELFSSIIDHLEGATEVLSEDFTFAYQPSTKDQISYCRGRIVVLHENGQVYKYHIEYFHQPLNVKKFSIRCVGEVVTSHYTPPEDEM